MSADAQPATSESGHHDAALNTALALAVLLFGAMVFTHLSYPLLWSDEADSIAHGQRILKYGYPKVHDGPNTLFLMKAENFEIGVDHETDAYTGTPWVGYYVGAIGAWMASGVDDVYEKTLRFRLPFTLFGVAGLAAAFLAVAPAFGGTPGRRRGAAIAYLLLLSASISLILHLREARYYGVVVFLLGVLLHEFSRRHFFGTIGYGRYFATSFIAVFLLFNTFYPAFGVWCVATTLYLAVAALRSPGSLFERGVELAKSNAPVFVGALAALPLLFYFDFLAQGVRWTDEFGGGVGHWVGNIGAVLHQMLRYEWLGPVLVLRTLVLAQRPGEWSDALRPLARVASFLCVLLIGYGVLIARSPVYFDRYFVPMGPLLILLFLVDVALWLGSRKPKSWQVAGVAVCALVALGIRAPEIGGRLHEMRHQYKGPVDYVVPYILDEYDDPTSLVVATNYGDPILMVYLGCHVTVGFMAPNIETDLEITPDIIVPRPWARSLDHLRTLANRASYRETRFEVKRQMTNNIAALSPFVPGGMQHRWETVLAESPQEAAAILERTTPR